MLLILLRIRISRSSIFGRSLFLINIRLAQIYLGGLILLLLHRILIPSFLRSV